MGERLNTNINFYSINAFLKRTLRNWDIFQKTFNINTHLIEQICNDIIQRNFCVK